MKAIPPDWGNFVVAEVGAAAALTGRVSVAVAINLPRILSYAHLPGRAAEGLVTLVVPGQPAPRGLWS
jgi:hypothetical protein